VKEYAVNLKNKVSTICIIEVFQKIERPAGEELQNLDPGCAQLNHFMKNLFSFLFSDWIEINVLLQMVDEPFSHLLIGSLGFVT